MSNVAADINKLIMSSNLSNDELNAIQSAINYSRAQLAKQIKWTLVKGTKVKFTSTKTGQLVTGTIAKINRKYIVVLTPTTRWRVPANMLSAA